MHVRELRAGAQQASAAAILASGLKLAISLLARIPASFRTELLTTAKPSIRAGS